MTSIGIVLGHTQALYREGLRRVLGEHGFDVLAVAADADGVLRAAAAHRPAMIVSDVGCGSGLELRRRFPSTAVFVLADAGPAHAAEQLLADGAAGVGFVLDDRVSDLGQFTGWLRRVAAGGSVLDPEIVASLLGHASEPLERLTAREREVLSHVANGRSNRGIALTVSISEHAVERHVSRILAKLDIPAGRSLHRRVLATLAFLHANSQV